MTEKKKEEDYSIYVGQKPIMTYVSSVVAQFVQGTPEIVVRARGKFTSKAVDIVEISTKRFLKGDVKVTDIKIDSEEFQAEDKDTKALKTVRVSTIDITLTKK